MKANTNARPEVTAKPAKTRRPSPEHRCPECEGYGSFGSFFGGRSRPCEYCDGTGYDR